LISNFLSTYESSSLRQRGMRKMNKHTTSCDTSAVVSSISDNGRATTAKMQPSVGGSNDSAQAAAFGGTAVGPATGDNGTAVAGDHVSGPASGSDEAAATTASNCNRTTSSAVGSAAASGYHWPRTKLQRGSFCWQQARRCDIDKRQ
jgi:hypothetical protein